MSYFVNTDDANRPRVTHFTKTTAESSLSLAHTNAHTRLAHPFWQNQSGDSTSLTILSGNFCPGGTDL